MFFNILVSGATEVDTAEQSNWLLLPAIDPLPPCNLTMTWQQSRGKVIYSQGEYSKLPPPQDV